MINFQIIRVFDMTFIIKERALNYQGLQYDHFDLYDLCD